MSCVGEPRVLRWETVCLALGNGWVCGRDQLVLRSGTASRCFTSGWSCDRESTGLPEDGRIHESGGDGACPRQRIRLRTEGGTHKNWLGASHTSDHPVGFKLASTRTAGSDDRTPFRDDAAGESLSDTSRCVRFAASRCQAALLGPHRKHNRGATGACYVRLEPTDTGHEEDAMGNHGRVHRAIVSLLWVATRGIGGTAGGQTRVSRAERRCEPTGATESKVGETVVCRVASCWALPQTTAVSSRLRCVATGARTERQRRCRVDHDLATWIDRGARRDVSCRWNGSTRQVIGWRTGTHYRASAHGCVASRLVTESVLWSCSERERWLLASRASWPVAVVTAVSQCGVCGRSVVRARAWPQWRCTESDVDVGATRS